MDSGAYTCIHTLKNRQLPFRLHFKVVFHYLSTGTVRPLPTRLLCAVQDTPDAAHMIPGPEAVIGRSTIHFRGVGSVTTCIYLYVCVYVFVYVCVYLCVYLCEYVFLVGRQRQ